MSGPYEIPRREMIQIKTCVRAVVTGPRGHPGSGSGRAGGGETFYLRDWFQMISRDKNFCPCKGNYIIIYYVGDNGRSDPVASVNSRRNRLFLRTESLCASPRLSLFYPSPGNFFRQPVVNDYVISIGLTSMHAELKRRRIRDISVRVNRQSRKCIHTTNANVT